MTAPIPKPESSVPSEAFRSLSVPTWRGSTLVFPDYHSFAARGRQGRSGYSYGLAGTPTTRTLQARLTELEHAHDTFLAPSGLSAITTVFLALCNPGDAVLIPDNVYPPVRRFADTMLHRIGVATTYYDPASPEPAFACRDRPRLVWIEAPGSTTMEVPDLDALHRMAVEHRALIGYDNSWATPLLHRPIEHGADVVVEALTKYLTGHSDLLMGSISVKTEDLAETVHGTIRALGLGVSPDDCFLALRGMETARLRIAHVGASALRLAEQLPGLRAVDRVLHPGLSESVGHRFWRDRFDGASGVFSVLMKPEDEAEFARRFQGLKQFRLGASWGGTHSILAPAFLDAERTVDRSLTGRPIVRISVGLEPVKDLLDELRAVFA